jgi:hypothetical protein
MSMISLRITFWRAVVERDAKAGRPLGGNALSTAAAGVS